MKIVSRRKIERIHILAKQKDVQEVINFLMRKGYTASSKTSMSKLAAYNYGIRKTKPKPGHTFDAVTGYFECVAERPLKRKSK